MICLTNSVHAEDVVNPSRDETAASSQVISPTRRVLAVLAAVGPGLVLRGVGSWLVHEPRTAKRLAVTAGLGLGTAIAGGLPIGATGANPYTIEPGVPILLSGFGTFAATWWADIAVAAGLDRRGGARAAPPWSIELGTLWLRDAYRHRGFGRIAGRVELGRFAAGAVGLFDAGNAAREGELFVHARIFGAPPTGQPSDHRVARSDELVIRAAGRLRRDDEDRVTVATGELELRGRLDLDWLDPALAGQFGELSTGIGVERAGFAGAHDVGSLLLGTFGWGFYLGERGEAKLYYDHRRDSLAGGITGRIAGFVGSFGAAVDVLVAPRWAVRAELQIGNAWVSTLAVRYHGGVQ